MELLWKENWMPLPQGPPRNCAPGLEYLSMVDELLVDQIVGNWEWTQVPSRFKIKNNLDQDVYSATEVLIRNRWGRVKPFTMDLTLVDNSGNEVMHLFTPWSDGCMNIIRNMEVSAPPGNLLGTIERERDFCSPIFAVKNAQGDTFLRIEGPCTCRCCFCGVNQEYRITTPDGASDVGKISKLWTGFWEEMFTYADHYNITFPVGSDVETKAILLGALFFIEALFYEKGRGKKR